MAEREGVESSCEKGDVAQTTGRVIRDLDNGRKWADEGHQQLTVKAEFFGANDGMVANTDPGWLLLAFDMLTGIFDRMVLQTNVRKTVGMVCQPLRAVMVRSDEVYTRRMEGEWKSFKERQR